MHISPTIALSLALLISTATTSPVSAVQMGSKHNLYLVTCTQRTSGFPDCPLLIFCSQPVTSSLSKRQLRPAKSYTAVAYYANGPIETLPGRNTNPTAIATVEDPAAAWEGTQRVAKLSLGGGAGAFSSSIDVGAKTLDKGQIAGEARLDAEDFACFRDGKTGFVGRDVFGDETYRCTADYWCPSIQV
ncbi:hypothetical protein BU24DRAFT_114123 [Aaosphaeria arxii CBS 175.79]|uniref:Uncharacterized protein n=1 Tax=Aaosphaeria arxii CBS 175.79 TaxID=1450172 RepID=A0A6A5Y0Z4_9PLEO|nr:uncharacterized protein BU24DRAFT_114123 [Aaosphaeria arxii CBS 175.79]KAF2019142.1 hypothetical protein BU24DRAFT_114123 [Aaosphaeria arxii CBS 175.79]